MRSEEVHRALTHGATKFELCQLIFRGVRTSCTRGDGTPRECIGFVLHDLAADPAFTLQYQGVVANPGALAANTPAIA